VARVFQATLRKPYEQSGSDPTRGGFKQRAVKNIF
jgi:hypothetical protein